MAKRKTEVESTLADQVAEYVGKSLGELLNRRDALLKEVSTIDGQVAAVSKRVAKQFGKWVPYTHTDAPISFPAAKFEAKPSRTFEKRASQWP